MDEQSTIQSVSTKTHLICSKCNTKKFCSKDRYDKLLQKFGSVEKLKLDYICRSCRK